MVLCLYTSKFYYICSLANHPDMIRTIIIESDPEISHAVSNVIDNYFDHIQVVETTTNIHAGMAAILAHNPELVIMDPDLPDGNAFAMLQCLAETNFEIIVLSATQNETLNAIRFHVFDYLLKPLSTSILIKCFIRLILEVEKKRVLFSYCQPNAEKNKESPTLILHTLTDIHIINTKEILYCSSEGSYTHFYLTNKSTILVSKNLKEFEKQLAKQHFIRVHHTHLVNMQHVIKFNKANGGMIFLNDGTQIPVSVRKKADLFKLLEAMPQQ